MVVGTQIDGHLDLLTATLARPYMTDFVVAHVCRRLWRDQQVIAFAARCRARAIWPPRARLLPAVLFERRKDPQYVPALPVLRRALLLARGVF